MGINAKTISRTMRLQWMPLLIVLMLANWSRGFQFLPFIRSARTSPRRTLGESGTFKVLYNEGFHSTTGLSMAGFGGAGGGGAGKGKKSSKGKTKVKSSTSGMKPKAQWDRYLDLKKETAVPVAVRLLDGDEKEWLEVGNIKSLDGEYNELAVAKQRALIAEHAKRLYPLKMRGSTPVEWGIFNSESDSFEVVDKSLSDGTDDFDTKQIGFEGTGDPTPGFYCHYNNGRLVSSKDDNTKSPAELKK